MASYADNDEGWDLIITAKDKLLSFDLKEMLAYKDLLFLMVRRDFVSVYKQTILGPLWFLFQPIMSTVMYMFVFGNIANLGTDGIPQPLFYFTGTMLWTFFASNLVKASDTFINNAGLFGKVYFPRFTMPIVYVVNNFFTLLIQFAFLIVFYVFYLISGYPFSPTIWILATPFYILQLALLGIGIGIMISSVTTKYRDLRNLVNLGVSLLLYLTPVVYPLSSVPEKWKTLVSINPVTPVIEMFRYSFLGSGTHSLGMWLISWVVSIGVFWLGLLSFNHNEKSFIDVV